MSEQAIPAHVGIVLTALQRGRALAHGRYVQRTSETSATRGSAAAHPDSWALSWHESLKLLTTAPVGRIVYSDHALPAVQPVNFVVDDEAVVFRAAKGSRLAHAVQDAVVAFEADEYDPGTGTGWSVSIVGKCAAVSEPAEVARLSGRVPQHWAPDGAGQFVRISIAEVTGVRIGPPA